MYKENRAQPRKIIKSKTARRGISRRILFEFTHAIRIDAEEANASINCRI